MGKRQNGPFQLSFNPLLKAGVQVSVANEPAEYKLLEVRMPKWKCSIEGQAGRG
jgi:hypothetical protein